MDVLARSSSLCPQPRNSFESNCFLVATVHGCPIAQTAAVDQSFSADAGMPCGMYILTERMSPLSMGTGGLAGLLFWPVQNDAVSSCMIWDET